MISKELLKEILGIRWSDSIRGGVAEEKFAQVGNYIYFGYKGYNHWNDAINIYELAHKCKEWALKHKKELLSCTRKDKSICDIYGLVSPNFTFYGDTEPDAIFKACQYILDNKDK